MFVGIILLEKSPLWGILLRSCPSCAAKSEEQGERVDCCLIKTEESGLVGNLQSPLKTIFEH